MNQLRNNALPEAASGSGTAASAGSTRIGKYQLFAKVGHGGMADVFLAVATGSIGVNKLAVIKRLRIEEEEPSFVEMFLDEARLAARLSHPNVVHTYEAGEHEGGYFIAMEYLEGQSLNKVRRVGTKFSTATWAWVIAQALNGLHYAHELRDYDGTPLNIVHRDISPHNIFLTYSGEVKLVDFGIAKANSNSSHTETGVLKGKVRYMAIEQAIGKADRRSDIFAMGVVLWEMIAGTQLFSGDSVKVLHSMMTDPIPRLSSKCPTVPSELDTIVMRALEKEPANRYATAEEMRDALEAFIQSTGEVIRPAGVSSIMKETFRDIRETVGRRVKEFIAAASSQDSMRASASDLGALSLSGSTVDGASVPSSQLRKIDLKANAEESSQPSIPRDVVIASRRRERVLIFAGLVVVCAGLTLFLHQPRSGNSAVAPVATDARITVSVASEPSGALVEWKGMPLGRTPARLDLPIGPQSLLLSKEGFDNLTVVVDVRDGSGDITREVMLTPALSRPDPPAGSIRTPGAVASHGAAATMPGPTVAPLPHRAPPRATAPSASTSAPGASTAPAPVLIPSSKIKVLDDDARPKPRVLD